jgi:hypothetical protein
MRNRELAEVVPNILNTAANENYQEREDHRKMEGKWNIRQTVKALKA